MAAVVVDATVEAVAAVEAATATAAVAVVAVAAAAVAAAGGDRSLTLASRQGPGGPSRGASPAPLARQAARAQPALLNWNSSSLRRRVRPSRGPTRPRNWDRP